MTANNFLDFNEKSFNLAAAVARKNILYGKEVCKCSLKKLSAYPIASVLLMQGLLANQNDMDCLKGQYGLHQEELSETPIEEGSGDSNIPPYMIEEYCFGHTPFFTFKLPTNTTGSSITWRLYYWDGSAWNLEVSQNQSTVATEISVALPTSGPNYHSIPLPASFNFKIETSTGEHTTYFNNIEVVNCYPLDDNRIELSSDNTDCGSLGQEIRYSFNVIGVALNTMVLQYFNGSDWVDIVPISGTFPAGSYTNLQPTFIDISGQYNVRIYDSTEDISSNEVYITFTSCSSTTDPQD